VLAQGFKVERRGKFLSRHMDLVWEDVRKEVPVHNDKAGELPLSSPDASDLPLAQVRASVRMREYRG
jgi:hypothetical protein